MDHTNGLAPGRNGHLGESILMRRVELEGSFDISEVDVPVQGLVSVVTEEGQVDDPSRPFIDVLGLSTELACLLGAGQIQVHFL